MFVSIAFYLQCYSFSKDAQCTKTNVNGCDALVSIISSYFQSTKTFSVQHCTEKDWKVWSVIIFEKLTSSLNDHVDQNNFLWQFFVGVL